VGSSRPCRRSPSGPAAEADCVLTGDDGRDGVDAPWCDTDDRETDTEDLGR